MGKAQKLRRERKLARQEQPQTPSDYRIVSNINTAEHLAPGQSTWPIVRAYVPQAEVWKATGYGTAGIIRRAPNGLLATAFCPISLHRGGITMFFGKDEMTQEWVDALLRDFHDEMPPMEEGTVDQAAEFIYGAFALSERDGSAWPPGYVDRYMSLVPRPPGDRARWMARLVGPGGLTSPDLMQVLAENRDPDAGLDNKEVAIVTVARFAVEDSHAAQVRLQADTSFQWVSGRDGVEVFHLTRDYPSDDPRCRPGARQHIGHARLDLQGGALIAEAYTLSMEALLIQRLKDLLADRIQLIAVQWRSATDLIRGRK